MSNLNGIARHTPLFCALILLLTVVSSATAQPIASPRGAEAVPEPVLSILRADDDALEVSLHLSEVDLELRNTPLNAFLLAQWPGAAFVGAPGEPMIPVVRKAFIAPARAEIRIDVETAAATILDLAALGYNTGLMPMQAPVSDPDDLRFTPFAYDTAAYNRDETLPAVQARIEELGEYRGRQLYVLEISPVAYNAARNTLTIWSDIVVRLSFDGGLETDGLPAWRLHSPEVLNPPPYEDLRGSLNYLILAPTNFAGSTPINQFVNAKTAQGYNVAVYTVPVGASNTDIKNYIQGLWGTSNAPDYILIAADTPCYFDVSNENNYTMLPATASAIPNFLGSGNRNAPTDLYYACMGGSGDWYPDIAIGRMPARDLTELQTMISKTLYIMNGVFDYPGYLKRAAFMAGYDYGCGDQAAHQYVIDTYLQPAGFTCDRLYAPWGYTTNDIFTSFNTGNLYGVYYGHSDFLAWWEPRFESAHVWQLQNTKRYPYVFNFTCRVGCFDHPSAETPGEAWMRASSGGEPIGGVIFIGATRQIYYYPGEWVETRFLEQTLFDKLHGAWIREVGPAWQATIAALIVQYGSGNVICRDYAEMYHVLGDPSLKIAEPASFTMSVNPTIVTHCPPPTQSAVYSINIVPQPGFSSQVSLAVQGLPSGATAQFSVNHTVPPFSSTLTINNVPIGVHNMTINATAPGGIAQTASIRAIYSSSAPAAPSLTSPPIGAQDLSLTPTLIWSAVSNAYEYQVQVARDALFTDVVYTGQTSGTEHVVATPLPEGMLLFWRCRGLNACGLGAYSTLSFFYTMSVPRYFTEVFNNETFDLVNKKLEFTPSGSGNYYSMCISSVSSLPTNPAGGTTLALGNDNSISVTPSQSVSFYGLNYNSFFVNANGNITFGAGDTTWNETLTAHFAKPRIAGVFDDLKPNVGGTVSWKQTSDRVAVTYLNVPGQGFTGTVTFQIEMFLADGSIHVTWLGVDSRSCIAGLSRGQGVPSNYEEMDLSAADSCGPECYGDITGDGLINLDDLAQLLGHYGQTGVSYEDGDLTGDGIVNLDDLAEMLGLYGQPCP